MTTYKILGSSLKSRCVTDALRFSGACEGPAADRAVDRTRNAPRPGASRSAFPGVAAKRTGIAGEGSQLLPSSTRPRTQLLPDEGVLGGGLRLDAQPAATERRPRRAEYVGSTVRSQVGSLRAMKKSPDRGSSAGSEPCQARRTFNVQGTVWAAANQVVAVGPVPRMARLTRLRISGIL